MSKAARTNVSRLSCLRKGDRKINDNIELFKGWGKQIITEKVEEIKHKHQKNQLEAKPQDLIEAITRNSL